LLQLHEPGSGTDPPFSVLHQLRPVSRDSDHKGPGGQPLGSALMTRTAVEAAISTLNQTGQMSECKVTWGQDFDAASNDGKEKNMSDWLHNLPVLWMALLVFGFTYLVTAIIYAVITVFAVGERARSFKAISPGLLPPLGIIFGLFVVFTAAQVWTDNEKAKAEIDREASALRGVVILATSFPRESEIQLRELIRRYIADAATQEWVMMAQRTATLRAIPAVLAEALQATLALSPSSEGQKIAQREIATALETALDARRQRIIISQSQVNLLKWSCLFMQAVCALVAIAMVHSDNRLASIIAMVIFATGVAASTLVILAHDRPFTGDISIRPDALLQVMPEIGS
jgi:uncharacterized protein DUF4239